MTDQTTTPAPLSPEREAEYRALADAATPGPWCTDSWEIYQGTEYQPGISEWIGETCRGRVEGLAQDKADAAFVAAAREAVPALLAALDAEREKNARLAARVAELEQQADAARADAFTEAADDLANAFGDPAAKHIGGLGAAFLRRRAREIATMRRPTEVPGCPNLIKLGGRFRSCTRSAGHDGECVPEAGGSR